jgi:hypothetical protein
VAGLNFDINVLSHGAQKCSYIVSELIAFVRRHLVSLQHIKIRAALYLASLGRSL